jgi:hypothetical protein
MKILSKEVFIPSPEGRGVSPGSVTYISASEPILIYRYCYIDHSDAYDDHMEMISYDNGRTWSEPVLRYQGRQAEGGRIRYAESALYFDAETGVLASIIDRAFYPGDENTTNIVWEILISTYDYQGNTWNEPLVIRLGFEEGVAISFSFPIKTSKGRILVPAQKAMIDENGDFIQRKGCWGRAYQAMMIIGEYQPDGSLRWRAGGLVACDLEKTSRGLCEPTVVELTDGRIAMICRGSNDALPDRPGYKWLAFSEDDGETWSQPKPLPCTKGDPIESSATGSAVFRSIKNGKLYWIGNLCISGERPKGNWPRSPLVIAELAEEPFAINRDTITIIDQRQGADSQRTQLSNFCYYQDRDTGDVVLFMTRYGEADAEDWRRANQCRYRIKLS